MSWVTNVSNVNYDHSTVPYDVRCRNLIVDGTSNISGATGPPGPPGPAGPPGPDGIDTLNQPGGGSQVAQNITGTTLNLRTLRGLGAVSTVQTLNTVDISSPVLSLATAIAPGSTLISTPLPNATIKVLAAGTGISLVNTANSVTINNTTPPPTITSVIPYSGKTVLNTYTSGNPELSDFLSFGSNVTITSDDAFPATYPTLPTAFYGWVTPYRCQLKRVSSFIKFSIPTTITEPLEIYCIIHRCKEGDTSMEPIWYDLVYATSSNINVGDLAQRTFDIAVDIDVGWGLYFSFFANRPSFSGSQDLIELYTSSSIVLVSSDSF